MLLPLLPSRDKIINTSWVVSRDNNKSTSPCIIDGMLGKISLSKQPEFFNMLGMSLIYRIYFLYLFKVILALLGETAGRPPTARRPNGDRFLMAAPLVGESRRARWGSDAAGAASAGAAAASSFLAAASASAIATLLSPNGSTDKGPPRGPPRGPPKGPPRGPPTWGNLGGTKIVR